MYILLPEGVVAHGTLPPSPNHGVAIRLPDVSSTSEMDVEKADRYLWTNAEYNMSDDSSREGTLKWYSSVYFEGKQGILSRTSTRLGSLPATRLKFTYKTPNGDAVDEIVFAQRADIVYELGLKTAGSTYQQDVAQFEELLRGFRLSALPKGECSNG